MSKIREQPFLGALLVMLVCVDVSIYVIRLFGGHKDLGMCNIAITFPMMLLAWIGGFDGEKKSSDDELPK